MNCQIIHPSLSDYLDDGLPAGEAREIKTHLDVCSVCRQVVEDLTLLRQAAGELPLRSPNSGLWNRIRAGVEQEIDELKWQPAPATPQNWWQRLLDWQVSFKLPQLAGAGALALAVMFSGAYYLSGAPSPIPPPRPDGGVAGMLPPKDLTKRIDEQIAEVNQRKASWDPEVRAGFDNHLARIDKSLEDCHRILEHNAQDRDHQQMYLALYEEKLRLLENVNRLKW